MRAAKPRPASRRSPLTRPVRARVTRPPRGGPRRPEQDWATRSQRMHAARPRPTSSEQRRGVALGVGAAGALGDALGVGAAGERGDALGVGAAGELGDALGVGAAASWVARLVVGARATWLPAGSRATAAGVLGGWGRGNRSLDTVSGAGGWRVPAGRAPAAAVRWPVRAGGAGARLPSARGPGEDAGNGGPAPAAGPARCRRVGPTMPRPRPAKGGWLRRRRSGAPAKGLCPARPRWSSGAGSRPGAEAPPRRGPDGGIGRGAGDDGARHRGERPEGGGRLGSGSAGSRRAGSGPAGVRGRGRRRRGSRRGAAAGRRGGRGTERGCRRRRRRRALRGQGSAVVRSPAGRRSGSGLGGATHRGRGGLAREAVASRVARVGTGGEAVGVDGPAARPVDDRRPSAPRGRVRRVLLPQHGCDRREAGSGVAGDTAVSTVRATTAGTGGGAPSPGAVAGPASPHPRATRGRRRRAGHRRLPAGGWHRSVRVRVWVRTTPPRRRRLPPAGSATPCTTAAGGTGPSASPGRGASAGASRSRAGRPAA